MLSSWMQHGHCIHKLVAVVTFLFIITTIAVLNTSSRPLQDQANETSGMDRAGAQEVHP